MLAYVERDSGCDDFLRKFVQALQQLDGEVRSRAGIVLFIGFGEDCRYSRLQQLMAEPVSGGRVAISVVGSSLPICRVARGSWFCQGGNWQV